MPLSQEALGRKIGPLTKEYTWKDTALYALGVGAGFDELEYVYEKDLKVIPSFSIGSVFDFLMETAQSTEADLTGILHGEQDIIFHNPIPTSGVMTTSGAITHYYDKGPKKGALVVSEADTYHDNGQKLFTNIFTLFCRKDGGFGGPAAPSEDFTYPDRDPDFEEFYKISEDQPLIYRLSGDVFQLHVDPEFARMAGFEKPIMHGLCTHGYSCRAVVKHLMPGAPERMLRFKNRFSRTLYPGTPIKVQIWKVKEGVAVFRTLNAETGETVIDRGLVEYMSAEQYDKRKSSGWIRFDDRVATVTGAGAGLGRAYALELAKRGAKVVVNDLGGARDGSGGSTSAADQVVAEIKEAGGEAVANYDSVATEEGGAAIVKTALDAYGRLDILINNAGILRDKSFVKMEPELWQAVESVHLDGAFYATQSAFLQMKNQGYGRIVMTSSSAGLFGNFGQTNYGAAKMGVVGLMNVLKLEGARYNIKVNTIAPIAATRLTEDILPPDMLDKLNPEFVVPLVLYLVSEPCPDTGNIYTAGMGYYNRCQILTGPGAVVGDGTQPPSPEDVAAKLGAVMSMKDAQAYDNLNAAMAPMINAFDKPQAIQGEADDGMSAGEVFAKMPEAFQPGAAQGVDAVFQYKLSGSGGGEWHLIVKGGELQVVEGGHANPTTTILMDANDFVAFVEGKLNAMKAYTSGKLKIEGDVAKSQLLQRMFKI